VPFHGKDLITVNVNDDCYIAMKPITEGMGLAWQSQAEKLNKNRDKFNCHDIVIVAADGKQREMLCIPLAKLNGWLFSINPIKVKPEIRDAVTRYQDECFEVLYKHWMGRYQAAQQIQTPSQTKMLEHASVNKELMTLFGIEGNMQTIALNKAMQKEFGVNLLETWGLGGLKSETQDQLLTPTDIAERLCIGGHKVNPILIEMGFQTSYRDHKERLCYELTEKGLEHGLYLDTNKKHSDGTPVRQIKWYSSVIDVLKAHLEGNFVLEAA